MKTDTLEKLCKAYKEIEDAIDFTLYDINGDDFELLLENHYPIFRHLRRSLYELRKVINEELPFW